MTRSRRPLLVGNWKMNRTPAEAVSHASELRALLAGLSLDVVVLPPTLAIAAVTSVTSKSNISVGAQNAHFADSGSFTGEVSVAMLRSVGVDYVLIGHSERRRLFHETDEIINLKVAAALRNRVRPIVCVGETLEEFEAGVGTDRIVDQVTAAFREVPPHSAVDLLVAYEPVWAVGTLTTPRASDANTILEGIRGTVANLYDQDVAARVQLLYGGGLRPENAATFADQPQVDGALVGAATASADAFVGIARALV